MQKRALKGEFRAMYAEYVERMYSHPAYGYVPNGKLRVLFWSNFVKNKERWVRPEWLAKLNETERKFFMSMTGLQLLDTKLHEHYMSSRL